jgi:hypothetical protein
MALKLFDEAMGGKVNGTGSGFKNAVKDFFDKFKD